MNPLSLFKHVVQLRIAARKTFTKGTTFHRLMRFLFVNPVGMLIPYGVCLWALYFMAPVWVHHYVFIVGLQESVPWVIIALSIYLGLRFISRYTRAEDGLMNILNPIVVGGFVLPLCVGVTLAILLSSIRWVQIYEDSQFADINTLPHVSNQHVRYTPHQVASEEIVRRTQTSAFTPGKTRALGSQQGVAYITPLVPQGVWNMLLGNNSSFMYFADEGTDENLRRVTELTGEPFAYGEGMEVFDDIHRRLIWEVGFLNTYPEIYYAPIFEKNGKLKEVIGVVPYISYRFWWGLWIPKWGGVALFHPDGTLENLTPETAIADARLSTSHRLFPEHLASLYTQAQRFDMGDGILERVWFGTIRRPGKIEVPWLPGDEQMPFFLPMEDGSYRYVTTVEPDGEAYALLRMYFVNAKTGERTVYRFDTAGRPENLQGPAKVISYAKTLPGYVWFEEGTRGSSGTYRIVEPRPVTPVGKDHLFWMLSITTADYARVVATVFVDAATNEVHGPFTDRATTFAWLRGEEVKPQQAPHEEMTILCAELQTMWTNFCASAGDAPH